MLAQSIGGVLLPDGCEFVYGVGVLSGKDRAREARGRDRRRVRMYNLLDQHGETCEELLARVQAAQPVEGKIVFHEREGGVIVAQLKRRELRIPRQYVPDRCIKMMRRRDLGMWETYAAAMYVYLRGVDFMLHSVGSNFPRSDKVDTSHKPRFHGSKSLNVPVALKAVLDYLLIREGPFAGCPGIGSGGATVRHHRGKAQLRASLLEFSRILSGD